LAGDQELSMKAWFRLLKARTLLLCSAGVVSLGLAPVMYLLGLVAWQLDTRLETGAWIGLPAALVFSDRALLQGGHVAPVLAFIPHFDWAWSTNEVGAQILSKLHVGLIPALIGCGVMAVGISGVLRQRVLIRIHKDRKKDPVRRIDDYRREASRVEAGDGGRREPFIGAGNFAGNTDRRVA
jgi:hypothetical protein